jgi:NAD(P)-dependent dehydrogenase (short-subunit alcohol dehydrogenase family)
MDLAKDLKNKRVLITQADDMMGPAITEVFRDLGAVVTADTNTLEDPTLPEKLIKSVGTVDILIIGTGIPPDGCETKDVTDELWRKTFAYTVDPLPRLVKAVLPQMMIRKSGKIIVVGSAAALKGLDRATVYSAARGAQLSYVQSLGVELAHYGIQVNAIAQNFVDTEMYFPDSVKNSEKLWQTIKHSVPLGRLLSPKESANFVAYLASSYANHFVGQIFPITGGWVTR